MLASEYYRLYNTNLNVIFSGKSEERESTMELFVLLLETLANASTKIQYLPNVKELQNCMKETGVLTVVVALLAEVVNNESRLILQLLKRDQNVKDKSSISKTTSEYSMKGDLLRIIGNLSHNNLECQDEVHCIPFDELLDKKTRRNSLDIKLHEIR